MDRDELTGWLRLTTTPQLTAGAARRLLAGLGSLQGVMSASPTSLKEAAGTAAATALATHPHHLAALVDATQNWLDDEEADETRHVVAMGDASYPQLLLQTSDPPLLIYVQGRLDLLNAPSIAIVGSRKPSTQGIDNARSFAKQLSQAGHTVISGLALGVDGAAHEGALQGAGSTVAVVGTGLDRVYPKHHLDLAHRIARDGAVISEFSLGMPPLAENFPQRNRIIAGMSRGTLVIEAALRSGSLITARLANEAGREVFAVPGSIHALQSQGCHALIKQGAKLVERFEDVLEEFSPDSAPVTPAGRSTEMETAEPSTDDDPLLEALGNDPMSLDSLVARTGWPAQELNIRLLEMELDGVVARLPGQLFQRRHAA
jgi:DNA processing protein